MDGFVLLLFLIYHLCLVLKCGGSCVMGDYIYTPFLSLIHLVFG